MQRGTGIVTLTLLSFLFSAPGFAQNRPTEQTRFAEDAPSLSLPLISENTGMPAASLMLETPRTQTESLPDAPRVQPATRTEKFHAFIEDAASPLAMGVIAFDVNMMRTEDDSRFGRHPGLMTLYGEAALEKESNFFFDKYFYPSLLKQDPRYYPSASKGLFDRATYAATRIFITRKDSGGATLNTSYFLGTMTSSIVAAAYRPYWRRSNTDIIKDFGSSIGSDIGMNIFHEFWPGIKQALFSHAPRFMHHE